MKQIMIIEDDQIIRNLLVSRAESFNSDLRILTASSEKEVFKKLENAKVEAFFIDIQLEDSNGMEVAKKLRKDKEYQFVPMVFITGVPTRELEAFKNIHCYDYILKPFSDEQIDEVFSRILNDYLNKDDQDKRITLEYKNFNRILKLSEIIFIEYKNRKIFLTTTTGEMGYKHFPLKKFSEMLSDRFIQVHQSIIINKDFITVYDFAESVLHFTDELKVPVGRSYKKIVSEAIDELN